MPSAKGIKLTIVSQLELRRHPEFPHPETSQFTFRSPQHAPPTSGTAQLTLPSAADDSKADKVLGRLSVVSCYIPSVPDSRFWIRYNFEQPAAIHNRWYYFKLSMNGKHIVSWGSDARNSNSGQIMRGLFDPSARWNYKKNGIVYKNMGSEIRPFFFAPTSETPSPGNDGGLIEVTVFRARGRARVVPEPPKHKPQDDWGVAMPTGGLADPPQDFPFYDWHLKDAKDTPYVTFKFHYRSWGSLADLQLIPEGHPQQLLSPTPSMLSLHGLSRELQKQLDEAGPDPGSTDDEESQSPQPEGASADSYFPKAGHILLSTADSPDSCLPKNDQAGVDSISSDSSNTPWLTSIFDESPERNAASSRFENSPLFSLIPEGPPSQYRGLRERRSLRRYSLRSKFSAAKAEEPSVPEVPLDDNVSENPWRHYLARPLPEIPAHECSPRHARKSSGVSTVSITSSLRSELGRYRVASPEPMIRTATAVNLYRSPAKRISLLNYSDSSAGSESRRCLPPPHPSLAHNLSLGSMGNLDSTTTEIDAHGSSPPAGHQIKQCETASTQSETILDTMDMPNITIRNRRRRSPTKHLPSFSTSFAQDTDSADDDLVKEPSPLVDNMTALTESERLSRSPHISPTSAERLGRSSKTIPTSGQWFGSKSPQSTQSPTANMPLNNFEQPHVPIDAQAIEKKQEQVVGEKMLRRVKKEWYDKSPITSEHHMNRPGNWI